MVGSAITANESDFLTVEYYETPETNQVRWSDRFDLGFHEEAASAAGFRIAEAIDELAAGYYFYVSGTTTSEEDGTDILTQLYYRGLEATTFTRQWEIGATWDNPTVNDDDRCAQVIVASTDDTGPGTDPHSTRGLVAGSTTDSNGNLRFVTLKYDPAPQDTTTKEPKWAAIETGPGSPFVDIPVSISHFTVGTGETRKLRFFMTGSSNAGSSVEDIWTVGFRENFEP